MVAVAHVFRFSRCFFHQITPNILRQIKRTTAFTTP
nr:MAG TPA_asm: hypothetical protein [Caudoviricetes sp.]